LLWKLNHYGIRGAVHSWFTSNLENRTQFTSVKGYDSNKLPVTCGVPRRSVLGPFLFLLYINDICNVVPDGKIKLFVDDTNNFMTGEVNNQIFLINNWLTANELHLNNEKTCFTVFTPTKSTSPSVNVKLNGYKLQQVTTCRYLGIVVDNKLKWTSHIETVFQKLNRLVGICYKLHYKLPDWCLRNVYFAFAYPHILYCIEVYGNTFGSHLDKLTKLNNKLLRILQKKRTWLL